jgi:hypothetical protein
MAEKKERTKSLKRKMMTAVAAKVNKTSPRPVLI